MTDPLDSCECGDYRRDHPNDGPCLFNDGKCGHGYGGDGHHGTGRCERFRLQQTRAQELAAIEASAQGMSAGTAKTEGLGATPASPVAASHAPELGATPTPAMGDAK